MMIKMIASVLCFVIGGLMLIGFFVNLEEKGLTKSDLIAVIFFGVLPIIVGIVLLRSNYQNQKRAREAQERALKEEKEGEIIRLAQRKKGRLTVTEVAAATSLTLEEAEKILQEMVTRGYVGLKVTNSGILVYEFYEITRGDKDSAKGILE